jgi:hypothetical protein
VLIGLVIAIGKPEENQVLALKFDLEGALEVNHPGSIEKWFAFQSSIQVISQEFLTVLDVLVVGNCLLRQAPQFLLTARLEIQSLLCN